MRIMCGSMESFLRNLADGQVYRRRVYVQRSRRAVNTDGSVEQIVLQATAVMVHADEDGEALLQLGLDCGLDRHTKHGDMDGSRAYEASEKQLRQFCETCDLQVMPGVLDM